MAQVKEWKETRNAQVLAVLVGHSQSHPTGPVQPAPKDTDKCAERRGIKQRSIPLKLPTPTSPTQEVTIPRLEFRIHMNVAGRTR